MIKPSIKFNNVFIIQVKKILSLSFSARKMENIKDFLMKKNTCVMVLIMIYENNGEITKQFYRVLSCIIYYLVDNYFCIYYLSCQSKTLSSISS